MGEYILELKTDQVVTFYESIDESVRLKRSNANQIEFLTTTEFLNRYIKAGDKLLDACAGAGIYAFYYADRGLEVFVRDLVEKNIEEIKTNQAQHADLVDIQTGSILNLGEFDDETFDVVLNMGAYYHLTDKEQRVAAIEESLCVLKSGGIYALAYVNRHANTYKFLDMFTDDFELLEAYYELGYHSKNKVFFSASPEQVEDELRLFDVEVLNHVGTDGMKYFIKDKVNAFNENDFSKWMQFHFKICEERSSLGASEHGLIILRKK